MTLLLGLIFGGIGTVYLAWGKKQHDALFLVVGIALIIFPYFFDSAMLTVIVGALLAGVPIARAKGWI